MPYSRPAVTPEWVRITQVAAVLGVDPRTVIRMLKRGDLKNVRAIELGKSVWVHRADWQAELERRQIVAASA
ncbi:DNA-binding protein [Streptomyces sp. SHP22-7]|nr:DNA-binding protein [Streptomyces sp. SHP22-7]RIH58302.1 DNA-binding protein [Streptomyces sp. SHP22-7]RIH58434.1 DNA-binding protein [Streptomyces sp. SHP22-7]